MSYVEKKLYKTKKTREDVTNWLRMKGKKDNKNKYLSENDPIPKLHA